MAPHVRSARPVFTVENLPNGGKQIVADLSNPANIGIKFPVVKVSADFRYASQLASSLEDYYYNTPASYDHGLIKNMAKYFDNGWDIYLQLGASQGVAHARWNYVDFDSGNFDILANLYQPEVIVTISREMAAGESPLSIDDFIFEERGTHTLFTGAHDSKRIGGVCVHFIPDSRLTLV
jgi:hypothetical protein